MRVLVVVLGAALRSKHVEEIGTDPVAGFFRKRKFNFN
jgi:hypothetical protein